MRRRRVIDYHTSRVVSKAWYETIELESKRGTQDGVMMLGSLGAMYVRTTRVRESLCFRCVCTTYSQSIGTHYAAYLVLIVLTRACVFASSDVNNNSLPVVA